MGKRMPIASSDAIIMCVVCFFIMAFLSAVVYYKPIPFAIFFCLMIWIIFFLATVVLISYLIQDLKIKIKIDLIWFLEAIITPLFHFYQE